jgi:type I restriction enzyme, S subunit
MVNKEILPKGWALATIGDIAEYINGRAFKPSEWEENGRPIIRIQNLTGSTDTINRYSKTVEEKFLVKDGDFLISWSATLGAFIYKGEEAVLNQHIFRVIPRVDKQFLFYLISAYILELKQKVHGTGMQHITKGKFEESVILLSPLPEQRRIVSKIDELFSDLDVGVSSLKKAKAELARYRQSVLSHAFSGKLTAEWRETHKSELEPASALLERIRDECAKNAKTKRKETTAAVAADLLNLPEGGEWTTVGDIQMPVETVNPKKDTPDKQFIYIDIASIDNGLQKITSPKKYIGRDAPSRARQVVRAGDIIFSTVRTYLKNIAFVDGIYDNHVASTGFCVIRPHEEVNKKYLFYQIQTDKFLNPLTKIQRGTSYPAVRDSDVFAQWVALPSTDEQLQIVSEIDRRFSIIDSMEKTIDQSLIEASHLRQSILKRAFEGKLVPQDPSDEPASVLLEKIKRNK